MEQAKWLFFGDVDNKISPKIELSLQNKDEVRFVIDTDRWNEGDKIKQLRDFCDKENKVSALWQVSQSNPCFELWLYYHHFDLKPTVQAFKDCSFKEFVNNSIKGGFDNRKHPIEIETAINNSKTNFSLYESQPDFLSTELHLLGGQIVIYISTELKKAKEKAFAIAEALKNKINF